QAEDGIRDPLVTGVQTCALPIYELSDGPPEEFLAQHPRQVYQVFRSDLGQELPVPIGVHEDVDGADGGIELLDTVEDDRVERAQIGRASCRERGEISKGVER